MLADKYFLTDQSKQLLNYNWRISAAWTWWGHNTGLHVKWTIRIICTRNMKCLAWNMSTIENIHEWLILPKRGVISAFGLNLDTPCPRKECIWGNDYVHDDIRNIPKTIQYKDIESRPVVMMELMYLRRYLIQMIWVIEHLCLRCRAFAYPNLVDLHT